MFAILREQKGSAAVIAALAMTVLAGFAAIVVDVGVLYLNKAQLANMADSAALAGVQDLPLSPDTAVATAQSYAQLNGKSGDSVQIQVNGGNKVLQVDASRSVNLLFARIFGLAFSQVRAQAAASVTPISGVSGVVPFGVVRQEFVYGQTYRLKYGAGEGYNGNFAALALGAYGGKNYLDNIKYGYPGKLEMVDWVPLLVDTEPGNMSGPTTTGVEYRIGLDPYATFATVERGSPRVVVVPVINSLEGNGRHEVQVVGFAGFFLEGVGGSGTNNYVTGKFMQLVSPGDISGNVGDYGVYGTRLIQ